MKNTVKKLFDLGFKISYIAIEPLSEEEKNQGKQYLDNLFAPYFSGAITNFSVSTKPLSKKEIKKLYKKYK